MNKSAESFEKRFRAFSVCFIMKMCLKAALFLLTKKQEIYSQKKISRFLYLIFC